MLRIARILFWLGVVVIIGELAVDLTNVIHMRNANISGYNVSNFIYLLMSAVYQGGVLIGLGKILEVLHNR